MTDFRRRSMLGAAAGLAGGLAGALLPAAAQAQAPALPRPLAWPAQIHLLDGRVLAARELNARPALVVFWSSTCPFCRSHNRHMQKLYRAAEGTDLLVLGVSIDRDPAQAAEHVRHEGYGFAVTCDAAVLAPLFDARRVIPRTYAVERGARLVAAIPGEMFEEDVMEFLRLAHKS